MCLVLRFCWGATFFGVATQSCFWKWILIWPQQLKAPGSLPDRLWGGLGQILRILFFLFFFWAGEGGLGTCSTWKIEFLKIQGGMGEIKGHKCVAKRMNNWLGVLQIFSRIDIIRVKHLRVVLRVARLTGIPLAHLGEPA